MKSCSCIWLILGCNRTARQGTHKILVVRLFSFVHVCTDMFLCIIMDTHRAWGRDQRTTLFVSLCLQPCLTQDFFVEYYWAHQLSWSASFLCLPSLLLQEDWGYRCVLLCFMWVLGIGTQVLELVSQVLYPLTHLFCGAFVVLTFTVRNWMTGNLFDRHNLPFWRLADVLCILATMISNCIKYS